MRTTLNIDAELLDDIVKMMGETTKSKAVDKALREYKRQIHIQEFIDSWGKIIVDDYDEEDRKADEERERLLDSIGKEPA